MNNTLMTTLALSFGGLFIAGPSLSQSVDAPYAQHLVTSTMAAHRELQKMGIHAIPPGRQDEVIVACSVPSKIGKKSSAGDLEVEQSGKPSVKTVTDKQFYDLAIPLSDARNRAIGMIVMEMRFAGASSAAESVAKAENVVKEIESKIPSLQALFDKAPAASAGRANH